MFLSLGVRVSQKPLAGQAKGLELVNSFLTKEKRKERSHSHREHTHTHTHTHTLGEVENGFTTFLYCIQPFLAFRQKDLCVRITS